MAAAETPTAARRKSGDGGESDGWSLHAGSDHGEDPLDFSPPAIDPANTTEGENDLFWDAREDAMLAGFSSLFWIGDGTAPETPMNKTNRTRRRTPETTTLAENHLIQTTTPMKAEAQSSLASSTSSPGSNGKPQHNNFQAMSIIVLPPTHVSDDSDSGILAAADHQNKAGKEEIGLNETFDESDSCSEALTPLDSVDDDAEFDPSLRAQLTFEAKYSGMGVASLVCYCLAHLTIYELINITCVELGDTLFAKYGDWFYAAILFTAIGLLRLTGFLWSMLGRRRSKAKQRFLKRLEHGCWDARLTQWLKKHETAKALVEITAFYLAYLALNNFWYKFLLCVADQRESINPQLPSVRHRLRQQNSAECSISDSDDDVSGGIDWDNLDDTFLYHRLAKASYYHYSGADEQAPLFSLPTALMTYSMGLAFSILGLSKFGFAFVDNW